MNDVAFLLMDLQAAQRADLAFRLLTLYLERTGDYQGLRLLRFYEVYRALTRAKIALIRGQQGDPGQTDAATKESRRYLALASGFLAIGPPTIWITHGVSGSGKSTKAMKVVQSKGAIRIRSDIERQRYYGSSGDRYSKGVTDFTYLRLEGLARSIIDSGYSVVVDATFLERHRRRRFQSLAQERGVAFHILDCRAPIEELCRRIQSRQADASEATLDVLQTQLGQQRPLSQDELALVVEPPVADQTR